MKVSVVVAAHNLGPCLDTCIRSLLAQTLSPGEYEVLFVDDGSDDGTCERLQALASQHSHIRVIHSAATGGPGRPRNIGIEVASGEYLVFLDPDDHFTPTALERMYAVATRDNADILLGKLVGRGAQHVAGHVFRESRAGADLLRDEIFRLVTPHQMFRTAFLLQHRLRFAEAPVPFEDDRFAVSAYFHAKVISVLADEVCCHAAGQSWAGQNRLGRNESSRTSVRRNSLQQNGPVQNELRQNGVRQNGHVHYPAMRFDPVAQYQGIRRVLDVVAEHTAPGDDRDRLYAYWYTTAMLRLLDGRRTGWPALVRPFRTARSLGPTRAHRPDRSHHTLRSLGPWRSMGPLRSLAAPVRGLAPGRPNSDGTRRSSAAPRATARPGRLVPYREARRLAQERFSPAVERWLPPSMRVRARLLDAGAYADIARLAAAERGLTAVPTLESVDWDGNILVVRASARLTYADGTPVTFRHDDGRLLWLTPVSLRSKVPSSAYDVTTLIADSRIDVCLRNRDDSGDYQLPTRCDLERDTCDDTEQLVLHGTARLDVRTARLGHPLGAGTWDCFVRIACCGWEIERRLARPSLYQTTAPAPRQSLGQSGGLVVEPRWTAAGNLSFRLDRLER